MGQCESKNHPWKLSKDYDTECQVKCRLEPNQVENSRGAYIWEVGDMELLKRFLFLGSDNTYYAADREPERQHLQCIDRLISKGRGKEVVQLISDLGDSGRTPVQDYIIFALAVCARSNDEETKKFAYKSLGKICRIPPHLFLFLFYCKQESGDHGKSKGWGRAHKRAVIQWYQEKCSNPEGVGRLLTKYKRRTITKNQKTETWDHKDIFSLAHPSPKTDVMNVMQRYVMQGFEQAQELVDTEIGNNVEEVSRLLSYLKGTEKAKRCQNEDDLVQLIEHYRLEREHVPTQMMRSEKVCKALVMNMKTEAKLRNLCLFSAKSLCNSDSEVEKEIVDTLNDSENIRSYRVHPIRVLLALLSYKTGQTVQRRRENGKRATQEIKWEVNSKILKALNKAFDISFSNIRPTGKRFLLAINVSEGMKVPCVGSSTIRCDQAAAAMMMITVRTESYCKMMSFCNEVMRLRIEKGDTLDQVLQKMDEIGKPLKVDHTDCALPVLWAKERKKKIDVFVVYTDNVPDSGKMHAPDALKKYRDEMKIPNAKLIVVAMASNRFTIADSAKPECGVMNIAGFDTNAATLIAQFSHGVI